MWLVSQDAFHVTVLKWVIIFKPMWLELMKLAGWFILTLTNNICLDGCGACVLRGSDPCSSILRRYCTDIVISGSSWLLLPWNDTRFGHNCQKDIMLLSLRLSSVYSQCSRFSIQYLFPYPGQNVLQLFQPGYLLSMQMKHANILKPASRLVLGLFRTSFISHQPLWIYHQRDITYLCNAE